MLNRQRFEDYYFDRLALDRLKADDCVVSDTVSGSSDEPPYAKHSIRVVGIDHARRERNAKAIRELERRCTEVEDAMAEVTQGKLRLLLTLKYQDGLSWREVGAAVGKGADMCRKAVYDYFKENNPENFVS